MQIIKTELYPSRDDAVRMTRQEKLSMLWFSNASQTVDELQKEIAGRLAMIPDGQERMKKVGEELDDMLHEVRLTIPIEQRKALQNTASDYEVRMTPKLAPSVTNVIMTKEEFRELVDIAREKCRDCTEDDNTCTSCQLFKLLTSVLPLDGYNGGLLCPYNLGEWAN